MRPLTTDEEYDELVELSEKFGKSLGIRLQVCFSAANPHQLLFE
jgi:hypothetical protein